MKTRYLRRGESKLIISARYPYHYLLPLLALSPVLKTVIIYYVLARILRSLLGTRLMTNSVQSLLDSSVGTSC